MPSRSRAEWHAATPAIADALVRHVQLLLCGGLRRKLLAHAAQAVELAEIIAQETGSELVAGGPSGHGNALRRGGELKLDGGRSTTIAYARGALQSY